MLMDKKYLYGIVEDPGLNMRVVLEKMKEKKPKEHVMQRAANQQK